MMLDLAAVFSRFWFGMITHLWQSTLILCLLCLVALGMRHSPARLTRMIWLVGLLKLLLPMALGTAVLQLAGSETWQRIMPENANTVPTLQVIGSVLGAPREIGLGKGMNWHLAPLLIVSGTIMWGICAAILLGRLGRDIARSSACTIVTPCEIGPSTQRKLDHVLNELGIPHASVRVCAYPTMPAVTGIVRPRILIPRRLIETLSERELQTIVVHERAHQRHHDPFWSFLQRICWALLFFYPLLPFVFRRLNESTEFACDEEIEVSGLCSKTYSRALNRSLRVGLEPLSFSSTIIRGHESLLRRRIERLAVPGRFRMSARYRFCVFFAVLLTVAGSFLSLPLYAGEESEKQEDPSRPSAGLPAIDESVDYDTPPKVVKFASPEYPEEAKKEGITGIVMAKLLIDTQGVVRDVQIVKGPEVFYPSVKEAAYKAIFSPARLNDEPVAVWVAVPIKFALDDK